MIIIEDRVAIAQINHIAEHCAVTIAMHMNKHPSVVPEQFAEAVWISIKEKLDARHKENRERKRRMEP